MFKKNTLVSGVCLTTEPQLEIGIYSEACITFYSHNDYVKIRT